MKAIYCLPETVNVAPIARAAWCMSGFAPLDGRKEHAPESGNDYHDPGRSASFAITVSVSTLRSIGLGDDEQRMTHLRAYSHNQTWLCISGHRSPAAQFSALELIPS